ncbi:unnamed protein product [Camellia sinensis]
MGNCWGSPVGNHSSPSATKPSTPDMIKTHLFLSLLVDDDDNNNNTAAAAAEVVVRGGSAAASEEKEKEKVEVEVGGSRKAVNVTPNLKVFTYSELKRATRNFRPDTVLGEGGFGRVFKGWVDEKTYAPSRIGVGLAIAVKKSNPDIPQGLQQWQSEVKFLGKFSHPNLVKLLGYCWEDDQLLLIYEYMQKGSLESHLFKRGLEPLPWEARLNIAIGAAQGLAFLHTTEKQVIYRDFKASNILLDGDFNAKLSDFGLAKLGPINGNSHVTTRIIGTYGYAAPEYIATVGANMNSTTMINNEFSGHLYVKSDVYGFGVVLLELLTGLRVLDMNRPKGEHNLIEWARPFLPDKRKLNKIMDPGLQNRYPLKAAFQAAELILQCLESDPKSRPSMEEVLETLQQVNAIKMKPKGSKAGAKHTATATQRHQQDRHPLVSSHRYGHDRSLLHHQRYGRNGGGQGGARSPLTRPRG